MNNQGIWKVLERVSSPPTAAGNLGGSVIVKRAWALWTGGLCPNPHFALNLQVTTGTFSHLCEFQAPYRKNGGDENSTCRIGGGLTNYVSECVLHLVQCLLLFTQYPGLYKIKYAHLLYSLFTISLTVFSSYNKRNL